MLNMTSVAGSAGILEALEAGNFSFKLLYVLVPVVLLANRKISCTIH